MNNNDILKTDHVLIRLSLRGRDSVTSFDLNETVSVAALNLDVGNGAKIPEFDTATFTQLIQADPEAAMRMQAEFADATADYIAAGGATPIDSLADAVVSWVLTTRPGGQNFTASDTTDGYVISRDAINIAGPVLVGEERFWRVTAVGTWGCSL